MCYDVTSGLRKLISYAKHRRDDPQYIAALEKKLEDWTKQIKGHHYVSGFAHPKLLVFTNDKPYEPQWFMWGLIPHWVKDLKTAKSICNQTLNARIETIFEKPAFKNSAKHKRCLIYIDAFYEYHHANGKTYPFHLMAKEDAPLAIAGLWDEWVDKDSGEIIHTVSLVTTKANNLMQRIHNNPKQEEARIPAILTREKQDAWLAPCLNETDQEQLIQLCQAVDDDYLNYYTVGKLKGKDALGDTPAAENKVVYPELIQFSTH